MSNPVARCLAILKLLKGVEPGTTLRALLETWGVDPRNHVHVAKVRLALLEEVQLAETTISSMGLEPDALDGLVQTIGSLKSFLSAELGTQLQQHFNALDAAVGGMAILVSAAALRAPERPSEVGELLASILETLQAVKDADLDVRVRDAATRHLQALEIFLKNFEAFGPDAALLAYAELLIRLQKAMQAASKPEQRAEAESVLKRVLGWAEKLKKLNELYDTGAKALENAGEIGTLLGFSGQVPGA